MQVKDCEKFHEKIEEFKREPTVDTAKLIIEYNPDGCAIGYYEDILFRQALDELFVYLYDNFPGEELAYKEWAAFIPFADKPFEEAVYRLIFGGREFPEIPREIVAGLLEDYVRKKGYLDKMREYYEEARKYHENLTGPYANFYRYVLYSRGQLPEGEQVTVTPYDIERVIENVPDVQEVEEKAVMGNCILLEQLKRGYSEIEDIYNRLDRVPISIVEQEMENGNSALEKVYELIGLYESLPEYIEVAEKSCANSEKVKQIEEILEELDGMHPDGLRGLLSARSRGEEIENYEEVEEKIRELCALIEDVRSSYYFNNYASSYVSRDLSRRYGVDIFTLCKYL